MTKGYRLKPIAASLLLAGMLSSPTVQAADEHWVQRVNMSGVVEVEYASSEDYEGKKTSDIAVATVEVNLEARINDKVTANITLLHEEDETDFSVDAAYLDLGLGPATVTAGQFVVPFGSFETHMLADPVTLEIAETGESALQVGGEFGSIHAAVYMFNGATQETGGDDVADQMGVHLAFVSEGKDSKMDIGIDYINNIADSDKIADYLQNDAGGPKSNNVKSYVPAQIIHANLSFGSFHFVAEHLQADKFADGEVNFKGKGAEISATNVEVAYDLSIAGMDTTVGVAMQSTEEAVALGMPKDKTMFAMSFGIAKYTALTFEYANSTDYAVTDGGTGKDATSYTLQLAVGF